MSPHPPRPRRRTLLASLSAACVAGLAGCSSAPAGEPSASTTARGTTATATTDEARTDGGTDVPPADPTWTTGRKLGVGTVADHDDPTSKTWFTLTDGALTEPRFPRVDLLNARHVSFLVTDGDGYVATTHSPPGDDDGLSRAVEPTASDALTFRQTVSETGDGPEWTLSVEHVADPARDAVVLDVAFEADAALDVYVLAMPTPSGRAAETVGERVTIEGGEDGDADESEDRYALTAADTGADGIVTTDADGDPVVVALALAADGGFDDAAVANSTAPAMRALHGDGALPDDADASSAEGVLELAGRLASGSTAARRTVALGFATGGDADAALGVATDALADGYDAARSGYVDSWRAYLADVDLPESVAGDDALADQYRSAAMVLKAVEDKTYTGAGVASPSVPWGSAVSARESSDHGYNFVWARDLYQVFTAFDAMGKVESAREHLEYVFAHQHDGDGFLPQNTYVDGRTRWGGEQLDEIAFPLVMADQLRERHGLGFEDVAYDYEATRALAAYLVENGPRTEQERWEEEDGFSPSTIAAVVAGLASAARLAHLEGEDADALVALGVADHWARSVTDWTATTTGVPADADLAAGGSGEPAGADAETPYFLRVTDDADPDDGTRRSLANGGPTLDERAVVDAGFLELVRLGVLPADDPVVKNSLSVVDDAIRVDTPNGPAWYRYNGDGYGELDGSGGDAPGAPWSLTNAGKGRLWPILTGERAEYELLAGTESGDLAPDALLEAMAAFANDGRMIPEQVWDREAPTEYGWAFGEGTASATPLAWSMAGFVRLAHSLDAGEPVETPGFVAERYAADGAPEPPALSVAWPDGVVEDAEVTVAGETDGENVLVRAPEETVWLTPEDGAFEATVSLSAGRNALTVVAAGAGEFPDRGLAAAQRTLSYVD